MGIPAGGTSGITTVTLVSLDDVHAHLNITSTAHDTELGGFIDAIRPVVEHITGPIIPTEYTEYHDGGGPYIVTRHVPIISITSITEYRGSTATALTAADNPGLATTDTYTYEADTGIIRRWQSAGYGTAFWSGTNAVQIVYTAGYATVPPNVRMGALELIRTNYQQTQLGGGRPVGPELDTGAGSYILGFFVPNKVREMLTPNERTPGVA